MMQSSQLYLRCITLIFIFYSVSLLSFSQIITVDTIEELQDLQPGISNEVRVNGYYEAGDWGEPRIYNWSQPSLKDDNGGTVIASVTASTGRWIMDVPEDYYNVRWFGASPNLIDNQVYIQRAADAIRLSDSESFYERKLYIPAGIYYVTHRLFFNNIDSSYNGMEIFGDGHSLPRLVTNLPGNNNDLVFIEKNNKFDGIPSIEYVDPQTANSSLSVIVSYPSKKITVNLATDGGGNITTTANDIINEIRRVRDESPTRENNPTLLVMVYNAPESNGTGVVTSMSETSLQDFTLNSTIFRFHPEIDGQRVVFIRFGAGDDEIRDIRIRDIEIDGNNLNVDSYNAGAIGVIKRDYKNVMIENIYVHHIGEIDGPIANGISIGNGNIVVRNTISAYNWGGGFALTSGATGERPVRFENIHSYGNGLLFSGRGINWSSAEYGEAVDFTLVDNWSGMKAASDFGHIVLRNGIIIREIPSGEGQRAASWNIDHSGAIGAESTWDIDNVILDGTGVVGGANMYGNSKIGNMIVRNTATDAMILRGNGNTINNLTIENSGGSRAGLLMWGSNSEIEHLKVINSNGAGVLASGRILSGHFENCNRGAVQISDGNRLELYHSKFINNELNEIYESGEATLIHSGLDFSESTIPSHDRIKVTNVEEVANTILRSPKNHEQFRESYNITIKAFAAGAEVNVTRVEFYANDIKIAELTNSPYSYTWEDAEPGEYTIKAVAVFDDNSTEASEEVSIVILPQGNHSIILQPGWNMISTFIEPRDNDLTVLFSDIVDNVNIVSNNNGEVFWPEYGINEIGEWNPLEGYAVFMHQTDTLTVSGHHLLPEETPVPLSRGWNSTAYLVEEPMPVQAALASVEKNMELVTNNNGDIYWPAYDVTTLEYMEPGQGYKIFMNESIELYYPSSTDVQPNIATAGDMQNSKTGNEQTSAHYTMKYGNTGSSAILLVESNEFENGDEIGVWTDDGNLVGNGVVTNGRAPIIIWGRNDVAGESNGGAVRNEELYLTRWSPAEKKEIPLTIGDLRALSGRRHGDNNTLRFEQNSVLIASVNPQNATPVTYSLEQNYPNPFNPTTTIQYQIPRDESVTLKVYNLLGQTVKTLVDDKQKAGRHEVVFKADNLASGVYFYRLIAGNYTEIKRMLLLK